MGFKISEVMSGRHEFTPGEGPPGLHPLRMRLSWGPQRLTDWLNPINDRFLWQEAEGELEVGGLCDWAPCRGVLELQYLRKRRIRYELDFETGGTTYRFLGEKVNIRPWNLAVSHTTCHTSLTDLSSGKLISTGVVTFKLRHLPGMLASLRWRG